MSKNCPIMKRMKENYENRSRLYLTRRVPVIMRIDGKAFHTYTKGLERPFDEGLMEDMDSTAIYLCENIQGAKCAYVQSDEINILITDYDRITSDAWFDYNVQKMTSVSASFSAAKFNQLRVFRSLENLERILTDDLGVIFSPDSISKEGLNESLQLSLAVFDSRVFNIPKEEVANYFLARQRDAVKNSISSVAQSLYSHKQLHGKSSNDMQEMIFQKGINWNDYSFGKKRGRFIIKNVYWDGKLAKDSHDNWFSCGDVYQNKETGDFHNRKTEKPVDPPVIRSKWEVVETPLLFSSKDFKRFL